MTTDNKENVKGAAELGQDDDPSKTPPPPPPEPPPGPVKPKPGKVEGDETWEQKAKTNEGLLRQANAELATLRQTHLDFSGLRQSVEGLSNLVSQQGETLVLHTDILQETVGQSEELQGRVARVKERQQVVAEEVNAARSAMATIASELDIIGLDPSSKDEGLLPITKVFNAKNYPEAISLTRALVKERVEALKVAPGPEAEVVDDKGAKKPKPAVITSTPGATTDWDSLSSGDKIKIGLAERKRQQGIT